MTETNEVYLRWYQVYDKYDNETEPELQMWNKETLKWDAVPFVRSFVDDPELRNKPPY